MEQPNTTQPCYFAAVNSANGFQSYFDAVFAKATRLYIIKGGSGTGKSHLMRVIASEAESRGYAVEYYYCSSDPTSLDGIFIGGLEIGILDGTAPHTTDPIYPGIRDEIVNVGDFWDVAALGKKKARITELIDEKKALYAQAYRFLKGAAVMKSAYRETVLPYFKADKMAFAIARMMRGFDKGSGQVQTLRLCEAISMNGAVAFDTLERGRTLWFLRDRFGIADLFLAEVARAASAKSMPIAYSLSPLDPSQLRTLVLESENICITAVEDALIPQRQNKEKIINLDRFLDLDGISRHRARLRFCKKAADACLDEAYRVLHEIKQLHFQLEDCYIACMDFDKKEAYTRTLTARIFE